MWTCLSQEHETYWSLEAKGFRSYWEEPTVRLLRSRVSVWILGHWNDCLGFSFSEKKSVAQLSVASLGQSWKVAGGGAGKGFSGGYI